MPTKRTRTTNTIEKTELPETVSINVPLAKDLHRRLRLQAFADDLTLAEAVTEALDCWLRVGLEH